MFIATDNQFTARGRLVDSPQINISEKTGNAIVSITLAQEHPFKKNEAGERESVFIKYTAIDTKNNPIASRIAEYVITQLLQGSARYMQHGTYLFTSHIDLIGYRNRQILNCKNLLGAFLEHLHHPDILF